MNWKKYLDYKHAWKYHKYSMFAYIGTLVYFGIFAVTGVICLAENIALPLSLVSGLVVILFGYVLFQFFSKQSDALYEKEQAKENKV